MRAVLFGRNMPKKCDVDPRDSDVRYSIFSLLGYRVTTSVNTRAFTETFLLRNSQCNDSNFYSQHQKEINTYIAGHYKHFPMKLRSV